MGIKVNDIAFVRFRVPDLDVMQVFLEEFGMHCAKRTDDTLYMRGTDDEGFVHVAHLGDEAGFIGLAFEANSEADLDELAAQHEFSDVAELDGPGGGRVVRSTDPNGFQVEVVAGRGAVGSLPIPTAATRTPRSVPSCVAIRASGTSITTACSSSVSARQGSTTPRSRSPTSTIS